MTIQIEEGKFYRTREGKTVGPMHFVKMMQTQWPWRANNATATCRNDGTTGIRPTDQLPWDLVAEVPAPVSDQHAAETVEGKPDVEDDGFITRDTPEWAAAVETEAAEEKLTLEVGKFYRTRDGRKVGPAKAHADDGKKREGFFRVSGWNYDLDGTCSNLGGNCDEDIVAEWAVEPDTVPARIAAAGPGDVIEVPANMDIRSLSTPASTDDIKAVIADEAKRIVSGARRSAYGKPEANFERIARFWQAYFENTGRADIKVTAADVSPLMRLMKEARLAESPNHYDSFVDLIGYTLTGAEVNGVAKPA